ncbi:MAG TPA: ABC transporter permease subunit [Candidatus Limnocylindrales bacterium]
MSLSLRRVRAIVRKELREYRRNRNIIVGMAIYPLIFTIQPLIAVLNLGASASSQLRNEHVLLYLLGIPALVPVFVAAYAVAGERQQGTLEPALTTPIRRDEFLLAKALAAFIPSVLVAYGVFAIFLAVLALFARQGIASALMGGPDLLAQVLFTPPLASWTIWVAMAVSTRTSDVRVAQQLGVLASLPPVLIAILIALNMIQPTLALGVGLGALLLVLDVLGWRVVSALFDRERLITGAR